MAWGRSLREILLSGTFFKKKIRLEGSLKSAPLSPMGGSRTPCAALAEMATRTDLALSHLHREHKLRVCYYCGM